MPADPAERARRRERIAAKAAKEARRPACSLPPGLPRRDRARRRLEDALWHCELDRLPVEDVLPVLRALADPAEYAETMRRLARERRR